MYVYSLPDRPDPGLGKNPISRITSVSPDYFRAMGIRLTGGRTFTEGDSNQNKQVIVMCDSMARRLWPGESPFGKHLAYGASGKVDVEVVGTVADVKYSGIDVATPDEMYVPYTQRSWPTVTLVYRSRQDPLTLVPAVKAQVGAIDASQPVSKVRPMQELVSNAIAQPRLRTILMGVFGGMALILAMLGVYSVVGYSVAQRTREMGIRSAIGADGGHIVRLVLMDILVKALASVVIALALSLALSKVISGLLYEVSPTDPVVLAAVPLSLVAVALLASYLPARRAARIEPGVALRLE
jgi:predicted permease